MCPRLENGNKKTVDVQRVHGLSLHNNQDWTHYGKASTLVEA
jgi:hypothetical protein